MKLLLFVFVAALVFYLQTAIAAEEKKAPPLDKFFDYNVNFGALTKPIGAILEGNLGYNKLLWGDSADGPVNYGFIRPAIKVRENGFVHAYDFMFEVRPLPILGITAGHLEDFRNVWINPFNCTDLDCRGRINSDYLIGSVIVGYEDIFMLNEVQIDHMTPQNKTREFVDEQSTLKGAKGEDFLLTSSHLLGYKINDAWIAGGLMQIQTMQIDGSCSDRFAAIAGYTKGDWSVLAGMGAYHSNFYVRAPSGFLRLAWTPVYGLALH